MTELSMAQVLCTGESCMCLLVTITNMCCLAKQLLVSAKHNQE